jgi:hypothetical protein
MRALFWVVIIGSIVMTILNLLVIWMGARKAKTEKARWALLSKLEEDI